MREDQRTLLARANGSNPYGQYLGRVAEEAGWEMRLEEYSGSGGGTDAGGP